MTIKNYIVIGLVVTALIIGLSCKYIFKKSNTPAEKIAEKIVESETGVEIDFNASDTILIENKDELLRRLSTRPEDKGGENK